MAYATLADFIAALDELVPDMKGNYDEGEFIAKALRRLADDVQAVEPVDLVGAFFDADFFDPSLFETEGFEYLLGGVFFPRWVEGFSERFPVDVEALDSRGRPFNPAEEWSSAPRLESRWRGDGLARYLVLLDAPTSTSRARVRFRRPYRVEDGLVEVPAHYQGAVVDWAAALKCEALGAFYRKSIDPAGGSDIFDARQFAASYDEKADGFRKRYAELTGVGDDEPSFSAGQVKTDDPSVFGRGHYSGLVE